MPARVRTGAAVGETRRVVTGGRATCTLERASRRSLTFIWHCPVRDDGSRVPRERSRLKNRSSPAQAWSHPARLSRERSLHFGGEAVRSARACGQESGKPKGATSFACWQQQAGPRLCGWRKASRSRERVQLRHDDVQTSACEKEASPKDEGARLTVNRPGRPGRVTEPDRVEEQSNAGPLYAGSKASKGRKAWWGFAVAAMKHHEPHDWKSGATPGPGRGGVDRHGGSNHEGGARGGLATRFRSDHGNVLAGRGLLGSRDGGGAIFGNSNETSYGRPEGRASRVTALRVW